MSTPRSKHNFVNYDNGCTENNITAEKEIELINPETIDGDDASCEECFYKECRKRDYERKETEEVILKEIKTDFTISWKPDHCPYLYNDHNYAALPAIPERFKNMKTEVSMNSLFFACFCEKWYNGTRKLILRGADLMPRIGRRFQDWDVLHLMIFLRSNRDVVSVNLAYNNIHSAGFINLIDYIIAYKHILELNVQNNEIGAPGINHLCQDSDKIPLKTLRLNGNKFGAESAKKVALMLLKNSRLRYLDVAEVDQTASSLVYFTTVMRWDQAEYNQTLKILDISRPNPGYMYTFDSTHFASVIGCMLRFNRCLVELHLQKYNFSCHDIEIMLEDLKYNKTLHLLDLCNNNIGDHGMEHLTNWLQTRPMLSGLLLAHNIVSDHGARGLSFNMPFSKIRMLDLSYNKITDTGAVDILNSIKKSTLLRYLRLSGNSLGHCTAKIVERMLISGVLVQENIDIKPYRVDHEWYIAHYPSDHYKQRYYDVPRYAFPQPLKIPYVKNKMSGKAAPKVNFKYVDPVPVEDRRCRVNQNQPLTCICCECREDEMINSLASSTENMNPEACVCGVCTYEVDIKRPSTFHSEITLASRPSCEYHFNDCACCYCPTYKGENEDLSMSEYEQHPNDCDCCKCGAEEVEYPSSSISTKSNEPHDYSDGADQLQKIALILEKVDSEMQQHILKWINVTEDTLNLDLVTLNNGRVERNETEQGLSVCGQRSPTLESSEMSVLESTCCKNDENMLCTERESYRKSSCHHRIDAGSSALIDSLGEFNKSNEYLNDKIQVVLPGLVCKKNSGTSTCSEENSIRGINRPHN